MLRRSGHAGFSGRNLLNPVEAEAYCGSTQADEAAAAATSPPVGHAMRLTLCLVLVLLLVAFTRPGAAAPFQPIRIIVNGQTLKLDAAPILQDGVVMAPLRGLFEPFATAAAYAADAGTIVLSNRTGVVIALRLNDLYATVNGEQRLLPVPALRIFERVYVPASFIYQLLGAYVKWEEDEATLHVASQVTNVRVARAPGGLQVVVEATGPVQVDTKALTDPDRLVIDLQNAVLRVADREIASPDPLVQRVRIAQFQVKPYVTRVVLDLAGPADVQVTSSPRSFAVQFDVRPRDGAPPLSAQGTPPPEPPPEPSAQEPTPGEPLKVLGVTYEAGGGFARVVVTATGPLQYEVREFVLPDRLSIDIPGAIFVPVKQTILVNSDAISVIRAAQFSTEPLVTRVVVELKRKVPYRIDAADDGRRLTIELADRTAGLGHLVAIDPGHGGKDPGAMGPTGLMEKDVVLDIALRVRNRLSAMGIRTVMTRDTDVFIELADRPLIAKRAGATIYVSIHANASVQANSSGSETYYNSPQSLLLAQLIQEEMAKALGIPDRGIKTANFLVLRENSVPSVLVEVGFVSNPSEEVKLRDDAFRGRIADAVARGLQRFLAVYPVPVAP